MICCVCNNISDRQIISAINAGYNKKQIVNEFRIGKKCGKCVLYTKQLIKKTQEDKNG
jgi:bacterioferritin-associated ferredoxin